MRTPPLTPTLIILIAVNVLPIFGVLFLGWDIVTILVLYWLESVIIGVLNVPKILASKGWLGSKIFTAAFFTVHYGIFTGAHGAVLNDLFEANLSVGLVMNGALFWIALSFLVSHTASMIVNFFGKKEYENRDAATQMFMPYGRVVVMHLVVLVGGFLMQKFGAPILALIVLIALKMLFDISAHKKSHEKAQLGQV